MKNAAVLPAVTASSRPWTWPRVQTLIGKVLAYLVLGLGAVIVSIPWIWMFLTSLKTPGDILRIPLTILPTDWMWSNYIEVFQQSSQPLMRFFLNTLIIVVFVEVGALASNTIVAFSFSRLNWKFRNFMFIVVLTTMMLPSQVTMIPIFAMFTTKLHWSDTYLPLIVPAFFGSAWAVFLLRQFMMTIPREIDDAARIDGCNTFQLFSRVIVPMSGPAIAVLAIFTFNGTWNDFFSPLLYITKPKLFTIAQFLASFTGVRVIGQLPRYDLLMAASLLATVPMALLFFFFQRQFIQGIVITGIKG